eukprot:3499697-Rhodomonas_salina.8
MAVQIGLARRRDVRILSDEVYRLLEHDPEVSLPRRCCSAFIDGGGAAAAYRGGAEREGGGGRAG